MSSLSRTTFPSSHNGRAPSARGEESSATDHGQPVWPNGAKAAISFTMDNLGEALEVYLGLWPSSGPFGTHFTVKEVLPQILDILDQYGVKGTYFIESWSLTIYLEAVKDMLHRGHEVAWHSYRHEMWDKLGPNEEQENFEKSVSTAAGVGIKCAGFRPPGGSTTETTYHLLHQHGFRYVSALGEGIGIKGDIVNIPFGWKEVDAFYYSPEFHNIRRSLGVQDSVLDPQVFKEHLLSQITETIEKQGHLTILFHPMLQTSPEKISVMKDIIERISNDPDIWCAPVIHVADWIKGHPELLRAAS